MALGAIFLAAGEPPAAKGSVNPQGVGPQRDMINVLASPGPHRSLGDEARVFDRFVGTWDCDFTTFSREGKATRTPGQVVFGWIIDGWAMQDVWMSRPDPGKDRWIGTTVRFFDQNTRKWRVTWISPSVGAVIQLTGGVEGERIILSGLDTDGSLLRWSFNDIQPGSFLWRGENSRDGGKTWWLEEEHRMRRHTNGPITPSEVR
jgi:hypothetical protein